jgi:hypothetical protein
LPALDGIGEVYLPRQPAPTLLVVGVDGRRVRSRADFTALLRRRKRTALDSSGSVPHIIAVVHLAHVESWMHAVVHDGRCPSTVAFRVLEASIPL